MRARILFFVLVCALCTTASKPAGAINSVRCQNPTPTGTSYGEAVSINIVFKNTGTGQGGSRNGEFASGVLLNNRVVLTAGHVVTGSASTGSGGSNGGNAIQYIVHLPNLQAGGTDIFVGPAFSNSDLNPFYQTTKDSSTITTTSDGSSGYAAVAYDWVPLGNGANSVPGYCSLRPDISCGQEKVPGYAPTCIPGGKTYGSIGGTSPDCCSAYKNGGTCTYVHDIGVIILPSGSLSQFPCVTVSTSDNSGQSVMQAGLMPGASVASQTPGQCAVATQTIIDPNLTCGTDNANCPSGTASCEFVDSGNAYYYSFYPDYDLCQGPTAWFHCS
jgi:hypothetical protein